jgi:hypothetical protein
VRTGPREIQSFLSHWILNTFSARGKQILLHSIVFFVDFLFTFDYLSYLKNLKIIIYFIMIYFINKKIKYNL